MSSTTKGSRKYNENNYDRLYIYVEKGRKGLIQKAAEEESLTVNSLVNMLLEEYLQEKNKGC